ncbi:MAG: hypothetical protein KJ970_05100 [Candidatus Eisenbacteria bacterium]|uniref:HEAT repeat domain-containing protein n=1 Tax=Eiseniibacteriota bacterium TaxID=2212470 RepID=A0A948RUM0_UNCEI|nr:hypothetical protein [Candidatus Eisenbacteria bacterium]MBU1947584.1 hypothetical protein [Candidatus Eisenbacteria bacterium]MBU2690286.1 hypothetical protein [Candidatus Eisenbacteria bacterium]
MKRFLFVQCLLAVWSLILFQGRVTAEEVTDLTQIPTSKIYSAWQDSLEKWADLSTSDQDAQTRAFFDAFKTADVMDRCTRESEGKQDDADLGGFINGKMQYSPLTARELAAILADLQVRMTCHKAITQYLAEHKEAYTPEERDILATALLELSDTCEYPISIRNQIEGGAASMAPQDEILERMKSYAEGPTDEIRFQGLMMISLSCDPRAADLLRSVMEGYRVRKEVPPARFLNIAGATLGPGGYDILLHFLEQTINTPQFMDALLGLVLTRDFRAVDQVIQAYFDGTTGIRDQTSRIEDQALRSYYFKLWHMGRTLEPVLIPALAGEDPERRVEALELLDRSSRYGVAANAAEVFQALQQLIERPDASSSQVLQCQQIIERLQAWEAEKALRNK